MRTTLLGLVLAALCVSAVADPGSMLGDRKALRADRLEAVDAMRKDGKSAAAVEILSKRVIDESESVIERYTCLDLAARLGPDGRAMKKVLLAVLRGPDDSVGENLHLRAATALGSVAADDEEAFAAVRAAMPTEVDFMGSFWADPLGKFGARAVPVFVEWMKSDDAGRRLMAVRALGDCGTDAVPHLTAALADPQHWISLGAAESLRKCGAPAADVVPKLVTLLDGDNPRAHAAALDALGRFGKDAASAAPKIRPFVASPDVYTQLVAADALYLVTGELDDASVVKAGAALAVTNVPVHSRAAQALRDYGPRSKTVLPKIAAAMHRVTRSTRATLCDAIGAMGDAAKPDGVEILRALIRGDPDPDPSPNRLRGMDDRGGNEDIDAAVRAIDALGAKEAVPELKKVLEYRAEPRSESLELLQRRARAALAKLGG